VKLEVEAGFALGVWDELRSPAVCSGCGTFENAPEPWACTTDEITPNTPFTQFNRTVYRPTGVPLITTATGTRHVVVFNKPLHDVLIDRFPVQPGVLPCLDGGALAPEGSAWATPSSCRVQAALAPGEFMRAFGGARFERRSLSNVSMASELFALEGGWVAWRRMALPMGWSCTAPVSISRGQEVTLRPDLSYSRQINYLDTLVAYAPQFVAVTVPAKSRVKLQVAARVIADGGGNAFLCTLADCNATCGTVASQPWIANAPPATLELTNSATSDMVQLLAVGQRGIGYSGNTVTLRFESVTAL
jgi:hypothetical protein